MGSTLEATVAGERVEGELHGEGPQGALLLHGLASERRAWGPLPEHLAERGFSALAIDLRGHGASQGPRGIVSPERVLADVAAWEDVLEARGIDLSLVAGHSLGGLWAFLVAGSRSPDAVAAIASPRSIRDQVPWLEAAAYRAGGLFDRAVHAAGGPRLSVPYRISVDDTLDHPRARERWRDEHLIQETLPLANAEPLLGLDGTDLASRVQAPTLVAYGCRDTFIERESTHALYEAVPGEKTWMELPGPHDAFLDVEGRECARRVASWARDTTS